MEQRQTQSWTKTAC